MKITKIILPIVLLIAFSLPSIAQVDYEIAVITYDPSKKSLQVAENGQTYREIKVEDSEIGGLGDANRAILEVYKMNQNGWELYDSQFNIIGRYRIFSFLLRRKKQ